MSGNNKRPLPKSTLEYVLLALVPYSEPNIKLTFKPNQFFNDLEKISRAKRRSLQNTYYRAQHDGLIVFDNSHMPHLTAKGEGMIRRFHAKHLGSSARLLVIFDIPEAESYKRKHLRRLLHELRFEQIQKSVWMSEYDYRQILAVEIRSMKLQDFVQIYEAARLQIDQVG